MEREENAASAANCIAIVRASTGGYLFSHLKRLSGSFTPAFQPRVGVGLVQSEDGNKVFSLASARFTQRDADTWAELMRTPPGWHAL